MEYRVILRLEILSYDGTKSAVGVREIHMPFPPQAGLIITDSKHIHRYALASVGWMTDEQCFDCYIQDQADEEDLNMELAIYEARVCGWAGFEKVMTSESARQESSLER